MSVTSEALLVVGAGGHARVVADIARLAGYRIVGLVDEVTPSRYGEAFCGSTVVSASELDRGAEPGVRLAAIAIGDASARQRLGAHARAAGFTLPVLAHRAAVVAADVEIGDGTVIAA